MSRKNWVIFVVLLDGFLVNLAIILSFYLRFGTDIPAPNFAAYLQIVLPFTVLQLSLYYVYDLYNPELLEDSTDKSYRIISAVTLGLLIAVTLSFFLRQFAFPRLVFFYAWALTIFVMLVWRYGGIKALPLLWPERRVLVVGSGLQANRILNEMSNRSKLGYRVIGVIDKGHTADSISDIPVLGGVENLKNIIQEYEINHVIVATPVHHREILENLAQSQESDLQVEVIPDLYEIYIGKPEHTILADIPLISLRRRISRPWVKLAKRFIDISASLWSLVLLSPLLLIIFLLIRFSSPGAVIFRQKRVGRNRKMFMVYKFRTMYDNAEAETGPVMAGKGDPRITGIGGFLRRSRIDEIPQLWNILKGDMSLVGPRPERPEFVQQFLEEVPGYGERFMVAPGLTGLAQVSGHYATTANTKLKYDLIYIYHQSLLLDLRILMKTILTVLSGKGAH